MDRRNERVDGGGVRARAAYLLVALFVMLWILVPAIGGAVVGLVMGAAFGGIASSVVEGLAAGALVGGIIGYIFGLILGIIAQLSYFQTFYVLADNPSIGAMDAIRRSRDIMNGYRGKLFCLGLRYFCWALLCLFTFGRGATTSARSTCLPFGSEHQGRRPVGKGCDTDLGFFTPPLTAFFQRSAFSFFFY